MARKKLFADPDRVAIGDMIDGELETARDCLHRANVLARLLNALDPAAEPIEIDGNVILGAFKEK